MNNASINIDIEVLCGHIFSFLFGKYPRVDWPDRMVSIYLILTDNAILVFKVAVTVLHHI